MQIHLQTSLIREDMWVKMLQTNNITYIKGAQKSMEICKQSA